MICIAAIHRISPDRVPSKEFDSVRSSMEFIWGHLEPISFQALQFDILLRSFLKAVLILKPVPLDSCCAILRMLAFLPEAGS